MRIDLLRWMAGAFLVLPALASAESVRGFTQCDLVNWRELSHEKTFLKKHPKIASRSGTKLTVVLESGKKLEFEDRLASPEGGSEELHRVIAVGPKGEWVSLFEPSRDGIGYSLVHRGSGHVERLAGCPTWSANGKYFVALHEDLESGQTQNEASLWYCEKPAQGCKKIWSEENLGGRGARWKAGVLEIQVSRLNPSGVGEQVKTMRCEPQKAKARCKVLENWMTAE